MQRYNKEKLFFLKIFKRKIWNFQKQAVHLHRFRKRSVCENSSVGRAQPCQGWGRGFESRFSLEKGRSRSGGIGRHAGLKIL